MTRSRILVFGACCVLAAPLSLIACGDSGGGDGDGGTDPVVVDAVSVTPDDPSIEVGETVQLDATPLDDSGDPLNRAVTWATGNSGVAAVTASGLVTGVAAGTAQVRATSDGVTGSVTVTVTPRPVASVLVTPDSVDVAIGATAQLAVATVDASGDTLTGRVVTWQSSNNAVASVSASGLVTAVDAGTADITATSEGASGSAKVVVPEPSAVAIDSISPAIAVEGGSATIYGRGFVATPAGNTVTVDGVSAAVTAATETTLDITLPSGACQPARDVAFSVTSGGGTSAPFEHAVRPETFLELAVGEQAILSATDALCLQFAAAAAGEAYVIGVQSTASSGATVTPASLTATAGAAAVSAPLAPFQQRVVTAGGAAAPEQSPRARRLQLHRDAEGVLRERERELRERLVGMRATRAPSARSSAMPIPPDVQVGDTVALSVPDVDAADLCTTFFTVDAIVRVIGTSGIWLTDVENPAGGYSDADLQALSDMFDQEIYATDVDYLGQPTDLDSNGRVAILTTRRVNATPGLLGFVFSGDLFPASGPNSCASSNEGEIYYGIAPDPLGQVGAAYSLESARLDAPALIAHEFAHILQNANANHSQQVWEAEGQATFIEEVVGFASQGRAAGNDYGFDVAANSPATDSIDWYFGHFFGLMTYYGYPGTSNGAQIVGAPEGCGWLVRPPNGPCLNAARLVYDVPKSLLRYVTDQFGPSHPDGEQGVHQDLLAAATSGYGAIEAVTGLPIETVLARWAASLYVDGRYAGLDPALETSTWDLFDIWSGLITNTHLTPRARGFASFSDDVSVRAGSTAYFTISGAGRPPVAVEATSQTGASLPAFMQVWVVRVQ